MDRPDWQRIATLVRILRQTIESDSFRSIVERRHLSDAADLITELEGLLADLIDPDTCRLDHNGFCQAHFCHPPCPHERAKRLLGKS